MGKQGISKKTGGLANKKGAIRTVQLNEAELAESFSVDFVWIGDEEDRTPTSVHYKQKGTWTTLEYKKGGVSVDLPVGSYQSYWTVDGKTMLDPQTEGPSILRTILSNEIVAAAIEEGWELAEDTEPLISELPDGAAKAAFEQLDKFLPYNKWSIKPTLDKEVGRHENGALVLTKKQQMKQKAAKLKDPRIAAAVAAGVAVAATLAFLSQIEVSDEAIEIGLNGLVEGIKAFEDFEFDDLGLGDLDLIGDEGGDDEGGDDEGGDDEGGDDEEKEGGEEQEGGDEGAEEEEAAEEEEKEEEEEEEEEAEEEEEEKEKEEKEEPKAGGEGWKSRYPTTKYVMPVTFMWLDPNECEASVAVFKPNKPDKKKVLKMNARKPAEDLAPKLLKNWKGGYELNTSLPTGTWGFYNVANDLPFYQFKKKLASKGTGETFKQMTLNVIQTKEQF